MKLLRFLFLIFSKGSLRQTPFDFEEDRMKILNPISFKKQSERSGNFKTIKKKLMQSKFGYSILANLSYLRHARKMNIMLFAWPSKKVVYVRILKSASTSILKELLPGIDENLQGHPLSDEQVDALAFRYLKKRLTTEEEQFTKFALVRNPFHRVVSVYLDLFDPASDYFTYESYWFGILKRKMTFSEFIDTIERIPDYFKGPHFAPQHYILSTISNTNNILSFRLDKDQQTLNNFLASHGIKFHHQNKQAQKYDYTSFYNTDLVNKVYGIYQQDVMAFDYTIEYNQLLNLVSNQENRRV